jgi:hypothetical protein
MLLNTRNNNIYDLWMGISTVFKIFEQFCLKGDGPIRMAMTYMYIHVPSNTTFHKKREYNNIWFRGRDIDGSWDNRALLVWMGTWPPYAVMTYTPPYANWKKTPLISKFYSCYPKCFWDIRTLPNLRVRNHHMLSWPIYHQMFLDTPSPKNTYMV